VRQKVGRRENPIGKKMIGKRVIKREELVVERSRREGRIEICLYTFETCLVGEADGSKRTMFPMWK
jgi:hypothetical protein